ncbi:hypothetical protein TSUD_184560 [Trifolium subterraneum]|uniref:Uncharacterized protein n=1 Tax=Trifolium subterraneum TaxID=3900 RepID=A0A2Z6NQU4_TRISU|nr:hypothetical protein TSUD_184560 [Trifolium subterraneum]
MLGTCTPDNKQKLNSISSFCEAYDPSAPLELVDPSTPDEVINLPGRDKKGIASMPSIKLESEF